MDSARLIDEVARPFRSAISSGELGPGKKLPSELELTKQFSVSRATVRSALQQLSHEGLIVSGQGRGYFVRDDLQIVLDWSQLESRSLHAEAHTAGDSGYDQWALAIKRQGHSPDQEITVTIAAPSPHIAALLQISETEPVVVRSRLRLVDGKPFLIADSHFPRELVWGTELMSPHDVSAAGGLLCRNGFEQVRFHDRIVVRMPTPGETRRLALPVGTPVAEHTRVGYDAKDRPLRVMVSIVPGDRVVMEYAVAAD